MRILVVCGGQRDKDILSQLGFPCVTISNLDSRRSAAEFAPYQWSYQDAENLTFKDEEFDFCIVHDGLHHCQSPHRALLEMYRVAAKGLLAFEPHDSMLARMGVWLNFGQEYEVAAVFGNDAVFGGVRNTGVPNYVYRWSEREVKKTICSHAPWGIHQFLFFHQVRIPWDRLRGMKNRSWKWAMIAAVPAIRLLTRWFPRQTNTFGFAIIKPDPRQRHNLHPWIESRDGKFCLNPDWTTSRYKAS
jgi:SAM-dependent methyltransferase